jgi:hypothetical protein
MRVSRTLRSLGVDLHDIDSVRVGIDKCVEFGSGDQLGPVKSSAGASLQGVCHADELAKLESG